MSSKPIDDGVIKFKFQLKKSLPIEEDLFIDIEKWRAILFRMSLIGEYLPEQIGYGNLSRRLNSHHVFIITGTQTGKYSNLTGNQYTKVTKCDLNKMSIEASGPTAPSSESLTHYAIYQSSPHINYIFHIHSKELWDYMLANGHPKTDKSIKYGTKDMADAAKQCIQGKDSGVFVMEGHEEGIISYGRSAEEAGRAILDLIKELRTSELEV